MYACVCKGIRCEHIKSCVMQGDAANFREVRDALGVSTQCGQCASFCRQLVDEALAEKARIEKEPLWYSGINQKAS